MVWFFFFDATAPTEIYTLSLHDALPISVVDAVVTVEQGSADVGLVVPYFESSLLKRETRSEEHTSELQSRENLVCRLLLEKKKSIVSRSHYSPLPLVFSPVGPYSTYLSL